MPQRLSGCKCLQVVCTSKYQVPSSVNTVACSWSRNQRMNSNSENSVGVSSGRAKYRQHFAVQYVQSDSPGGTFSRRGFLRGTVAVAISDQFGAGTKRQTVAT